MSRVRAALLIALLVVVIGGLGLWAWLPWNPFEGSAGRIDRLLPPDVQFAVRFEPRALRGSRVLDRVATHPQLRELLAEWTNTPFEALEQRLDQLTAGEGNAAEVADDLYGGEIVVAGRGDALLVLSRISGKGKALFLLERIGDERLEKFGMRREGDLLVFDSDTPFYLSRHLDVLVIATDPALVGRVIATETDGLPSLADEDGYDDALDANEPPGSVVRAWLRPGHFAADVPSGEPGSAGAFWRSVFPPEGLGPLAIEVDLAHRTEIRLHVRGSYVRDPPDMVARLSGSEGDDLATTAKTLATGETMIVCGVATPAADAVRALLGSQPPERRRLFDDVLEEEGLTVDQIADELGEHFRDGVAAVVARLDETDRLDLDDWDQGAVYPVPATLVAFRLRDPDDPAAALERVFARAKVLFGAELETEPLVGARGALIYEPEDYSLGAEWALFRPCIALLDGHVLFCTSGSYLRRALAVSEPKEEPARPLEHRQVRFELYGERFRRYVDDQRWEFAERATFHDWARERKRIHEELDAKRSILTPADREAYVDTRIRESIRARNEELFPRAIEEYRASQRWLDLLGDAEVSGRIDGNAFRLQARIGVK